MGTGWAQLGEVLGGLSVLVRQGDPTLHSRACVEPLLLARTSPLLTLPCLGFKALSSLSACVGRRTSLEWPWSSWLQGFLCFSGLLSLFVGRAVLSFLFISSWHRTRVCGPSELCSVLRDNEECCSRDCCCSVAESCLIHCDLMDGSMTSFPVLHCLPEFAQTHVPEVGDAIQLSHSHRRPLLFLPSVFPSIRVFSNDSALRIRWPKILKLPL